MGSEEGKPLGSLRPCGREDGGAIACEDGSLVLGVYGQTGQLDIYHTEMFGKCSGKCCMLLIYFSLRPGVCLSFFGHFTVFW